MKRFTSDKMMDSETGVRNQYAALCWRKHRGQVQVLLITSRDTGRWVIPKGWPMAGMAQNKAAAKEAWEEAGVRGDVTPFPIGYFAYDKKITPQDSLPCLVSVFPFHVTGLAKRFPEAGQRRRRWFTAAKAARKVDEPELRAIFDLLAAEPGRLLAPQAEGAVNPSDAPDPQSAVHDHDA